ncbi:uncharacterized protein CMU_008270 [Cryptosporidium muris RN66]|uniref:Serine aminopeptidase S33 domain-containing protein n=1 Tax=Cryptosporidium muris (strain RN66) TaxID=441375 RepID=B6ADP5_CRYMR|nr:uncharacterized protein CMU_008270 [Cryptosporidium muris RN66]EEA06336.1 hypothetical protein CMU_008270 [Cryptosporidium muris RN66]|eukprot:XP_002140685.1 hypothetical protein [Cryptosporidium muris RN66]
MIVWIYIFLLFQTIYRIGGEKYNINEGELEKKFGYKVKLRHSKTNFFYFPPITELSNKNLKIPDIAFKEFYDKLRDYNSTKLQPKEYYLNIVDSMVKWSQYLKHNGIGLSINSKIENLVVVIHPLGDSSLFGLLLALDIINMNIPVLVYDLIGHGQSSINVNVGHKKFQILDFCAQLWDILTYIGWFKETEEDGIYTIYIPNKKEKRLILYGHSLGGFLSVACSSLFSKRVYSVVISSPAGLIGDPDLKHKTLLRYSKTLDSMPKTLKYIIFRTISCMISEDYKRMTTCSNIVNRIPLFYGNKYYELLSKSDVNIQFYWDNNDNITPLYRAINALNKYFPDKILCLYNSNYHGGYIGNRDYSEDLHTFIDRLTRMNYETSDGTHKAPEVSERCKPITSVIGNIKY